MKVAERLYISELLKPKKRSLIKKVEEGESIPSLYCITLPLWESAVLEIYPYRELISSFYKPYDIMVVGLAVNEQDALVILRRMVQDLAESQMLCDVEKFFLGRR